MEIVLKIIGFIGTFIAIEYDECLMILSRNNVHGSKVCVYESFMIQLPYWN